MSAPAEAWSVHLTATAEADYEQIVRWSARQFGARQARVYAETLTRAIVALSEGPGAIGVKRRDDIGSRVMTLHVARDGRKGRHFVVFRIRRRRGEKVVEVLRLLHDSMDLVRHLPSDDDRP